jgi:anti-sigma-K factor RskA
VNIQEYISGGMIESYALGMLTAQERFEFEQICAEHPEVKAALDAFELQLEMLAMENSIAPPAELKQKIADTIFATKQTTPVIPISSVTERKINPVAGWLRIAAAACFILLAGSIWWNMDLRKENNALKTNLGKSNDRIAQMEADASIIQKEGMKMVGLGGTANSPKSFATVYWDTTSHDVYLLVNNLPKPASDEQYQLWAIFNGQPQDMGFIEITEKALRFYRMKNAQAAQAFAITLEKKDGNPAPNLEKIYVMGNL